MRRIGDVIVADEGIGAPVLVVHGGLSDEAPWAKVAAALADRFRVVRIRRRLYRLELESDPATNLAAEVADVAAVAAFLERQCVLVGHSSGAVVALEALVAHPDRFAGAVLYEPPLVVDEPLGGGGALAAARAAVAAGRPGRALRIFLRDMVELPAPAALLVGTLSRLSSGLRKFVPRQLDDVEAINRLGRRLEAYAAIDVPVLLLSGAKSPAHLGERTRALAAVLPHARIEVLPTQGHGANDGDPKGVADLIASFATQAFGS